jgi:subtilisin family serine protease
MKKFCLTVTALALLIVGAIFILAQTPEEAADELESSVICARELLNETHVSETGRDVPHGEYWATQEEHDALLAAIKYAEAVLAAARNGGRINTLEINLINGSHYAVPIAVEGVLLPTNFLLKFDPEKITFDGMTENSALIPLPSHNPDFGIAAFTYHGGIATNNLTRTGIVSTPRFEAVASGDTEIQIVAWHDENDTALDFDFSAEEVSTTERAQKGGMDFEHGILTSALGNAVGMQGFEGEYAIASSDEIVEIIVQFVTPPTAVLRYLYENDISAGGRSVSDNSFEEQALAAHTAFDEQLQWISIPPMYSPEIDIFCRTHYVFNGVHMRLPGVIAEQVAMLPEVFAVTPYITDEPMTYIEIDQTADYDMLSASSSSSPFFINNNLYRTTRDLLQIDRIHSELNITGKGVRVAFLDAGVDHTHPEFQERHIDPDDPQGRMRGWRQHIYNPLTGLPRHTAIIHTDMPDGHGTSTAGAIIAMAPEVELWSFRRTGGVPSNTFTPIGALDIAVKLDMDVIYTWGATPRNPFSAYAYAIAAATLAEGVIVVVAAHNRGPDAFSVNDPGNSPAAITVGSGTAGNDIHVWDNSLLPVLSDNIVLQSGRGPVGLTYHIKPDILALGAPSSGITTHNTTVGQGQYRLFSGTSQAAPLITGIAALLVQAYPDDEPWEIKARLMNTARPLADLNPNSVFSVGAGFVQPWEALHADTLVTAEHYAPVGNWKSYYYDEELYSQPAVLQTFPFELMYMPSLSFGSVGPQNNTMPIQIRNRSEAGTEPRMYTISHVFNHNPDNAAALSFSRTNVFVAAGDTGHITAALNFANDAPAGLYEGFIFVSAEGREAARLPFAAHLTETTRRPITVTAPHISFNGIAFNLFAINVTAASDFRGESVLVEINRYTPEGRVSNPQITRQIGAGGTVSITPNSLVNSFVPDDVKYIEILVYRNGIRQHLLRRQIIQPVVFSFNN